MARKDAYSLDFYLHSRKSQKISQRLKGIKRSEATKQKISSIRKEYHKTHDNAFKNKTHTDESKLKMRKSSSIYSVEMLDRNTEDVLKHFDTMMDACEWIKNSQNRTTRINTIRHRIAEFIRDVRSDGSHAIYGYKWRYVPRIRCND